jgi:hypothetical protein
MRVGGETSRLRLRKREIVMKENASHADRSMISDVIRQVLDRQLSHFLMSIVLEDLQHQITNAVMDILDNDGIVTSDGN